MFYADPYKVPLGLKAEQTIRKEAEVKKYLEENVDDFVKSSPFGLSHLSSKNSML